MGWSISGSLLPITQLMVRCLLATLLLTSMSSQGAAQYALQTQIGRAFHGTGDHRGRDIRLAASRTLLYDVDLRLIYANAASASSQTGATLDVRGGRDGDPLHIGRQGIALGAFDGYVQTSAILLGLARDTRLFHAVYLHTAAAGGVHTERRKDVTAAQFSMDDGVLRLTDVQYGLSSFRTALLSLDLGVL